MIPQCPHARLAYYIRGSSSATIISTICDTDHGVIGMPCGVMSVSPFFQEARAWQERAFFLAFAQEMGRWHAMKTGCPCGGGAPKI
jgi:hypothetical protein